MPYKRIATYEEVAALSAKQKEALGIRFKLASLEIDLETFQPYYVVDGVRYGIEASFDAPYLAKE